jgi:phosphatidylinositol alpha-1,6-mannosyltransferase
VNVTVVTEYRFHRSPDGRVHADSANRGYIFWERYLSVFDSVAVVARVADEVRRGGAPVEGKRVDVIPVPVYVGLRQFLVRSSAVLEAVRKACDRDSAFILRVPGTLAGLAAHHLVRSGRLFAAELVGDPYAVFSPGAVRHPLRAILRLSSRRKRSSTRRPRCLPGRANSRSC